MIIHGMIALENGEWKEINFENELTKFNSHTEFAKHYIAINQELRSLYQEYSKEYEKFCLRKNEKCIVDPVDFLMQYFGFIKIGLKRDREELYNNINNRVLKMMETGLLEEARNVYTYKEYNSLNTVGYKELFKYFEKEWTLDYAISMIQQNTRRYAKKQMSWFNKDKDIQWFHPEEKTSILQFVKEHINSNDK